MNKIRRFFPDVLECTYFYQGIYGIERDRHVTIKQFVTINNNERLFYLSFFLADCYVIDGNFWKKKLATQKECEANGDDGDEKTT